VLLAPDEKAILLLWSCGSKTVVRVRLLKWRI
jgi:hypothetical protein